MTVWLDTKDDFIMWLAQRAGGSFEGKPWFGWRLYRLTK